MEGTYWTIGEGDGWPADRGNRPLPARDPLEPLAHAEGDLRRIGGDAAGVVGTDLHGLVIRESHREEDAGVGEVPGDRLEGGLGGMPRRRQSPEKTRHPRRAGNFA